MSIVAAASRVAAHLARTVAGVEVTVTRGAATGTIAKVAIGDSQPRQDNEDGVVYDDHTIPFLILATAYKLDDAITEPSPGDVFELADGRRFVVCTPGGEPAWVWADRFAHTYRVHTKQIA